jgi:hypothetical protein
MGAYNQFRGQHCCENDYLLNKTLKDEWGLKAWSCPTGAACMTRAKAALNGLDLEMGTDKNYGDFYFAQPYLADLKSGTLPMAGLDEKVRRNLRVMFATHVLDSGSQNRFAQHRRAPGVARRVAEEGNVLLKNKNNLLPLDETKIKTIAVIGENATRLHAHGGDSSGIKAFYEITPLQGILNRAGKNVNMIFSEGYQKNGGADLAEARHRRREICGRGGLHRRIEPRQGIRLRGRGPDQLENALRPGRIDSKNRRGESKDDCRARRHDGGNGFVAGQSSGAVAGVVSGHGRRQRARARFVRRRESIRQIARDVSEAAGRLTRARAGAIIPARTAR